MTPTNISALTDSLRAAGGGTISRPRLGISRGMLTGYICACATCAICAIALWGNLLGGDDGTGGGVRGHPGDYKSVVHEEPNPYETNRYSPVSPEDYVTILPRGDHYPAAYNARAYATADGTDVSCDNILLFLPLSNVRTVEIQLRNYFVAVLAATFTDYALVILDDPAVDLFGTGQDGSASGGGGLASLVDHPDELSRRCAVPCAGIFGYDDWELRSWPGPATPILCSESTQNVLVINGDTVAAYLAAMSQEMSHRSTTDAVSAAFRWASRLGARSDEASVLATMTDGKQILDYACGLLARSGLLRLNPRVAEDVASFVGEFGRGIHQLDAIVKTNDSIPLTSYLSQLSDECHHHKVYVATNSTDDVERQIADLPRHRNGSPTLNRKRGCVTFTFVVVSLVHAIEPSWSLYQNTVLTLSQLIMLARSRRLVADPSADIYALLRFFRMRIRGSQVVMKSRSTDDEGGNGPTFIKELVAVAEGTSEMYDVDLVKKPDPTRCAFALRPDGLGNRLEQIMNMAEVADSEDWAASSVLLIWQTKRGGKGRESGFSGTSGLLDIDNVRFMESRNAERTRRTLHVKECTLNADRAVMSRNAHRIRPAFGLHFADGDDQEIHPVGIHIRKSDRIALSPSSSGCETIDEFNAVVRFVTEAIVSKRPQHVFIASDDANEKAALATTLKAANISVVEPSVESLAGSTIPPLFSDFFGLSLCSEVWMASKFSSYAIMSARANGRDAPLYTYYDPEETILHRYQVPDVRLMRNWESYE